MLQNEHTKLMVLNRAAEAGSAQNSGRGNSRSTARPLRRLPAVG